MDILIQLPTWLVFMLVGLPQFSETVYSPSLPSIAHDLMTTEAVAEYTLTIYLFAFAFGMLLWGKISDFYGRKASVFVGLSIYLLGCVGCYLAGSIEMLMFSRFVQAFGGSSGSVLGQAMFRDVYHGKALSRVYALMASALGVSPAVGPVVGGFISQHYGWSNNFLFLICAGVLVMVLVFFLLPETLAHTERRSFSLYDITLRMINDRQVMASVLLVGIANGLMFSYYAEGSFYMINLLGLSPTYYGMTFILFASATVFGGWFASRLHDYYEINQIARAGIYIMIGTTSIASAVVLLSRVYALGNMAVICTVVATHMVSMTGRCLINSSALSTALSEYRWCSGTASSIFGFLYYLVITLCTLCMGLLHNGTIFPMPLYFLFLSLSMLAVDRLMLPAVAR